MVSAGWLNEETISKLFNYIYKALIMTSTLLLVAFLSALGWWVTDNPLFAVVSFGAIFWVYFIDKKEDEEKVKELKESAKELEKTKKEIEERWEREVDEVEDMFEKEEKAKRAKKARLVNAKKVNEEKRKAKLKKLKSNNTRKR